MAGGSWRFLTDGKGKHGEEARGVLALLRLGLLLGYARDGMREAELTGGEEVEGEITAVHAMASMRRKGARSLPLRSKIARLEKAGFVARGEGDRWRITEKGLEYLQWIEEMEARSE